MIDVVEILQHRHAGRPKLVVSASLGVDPRTVRKYVAPAEAEGTRPGDGLVLVVLDRAGWAARVAVWFPELVDARARSSTWPLLEAKRELIACRWETNSLAGPGAGPTATCSRPLASPWPVTVYAAATNIGGQFTTTPAARNPSISGS